MGARIDDKTLQAVRQPLEGVASSRNGSDPLQKLEKQIHSHFIAACDQLSQGSISNQIDKAVTSVHAEVQKYIKAGGENQIFLDALCKSSIRLMWQTEWDSKLVKKIIKIIVCLESKCLDAIVEELDASSSTWEMQHLDLVTVSKWSILLVSCKSSQLLVSRKFMQFLGPAGIQGKLEELMSLKNPTVSEQAFAQMLIKVNLQCFQLLPNVVDPSWWTASPGEPSTEKKEADALNEILKCLFKILKSQVLGSESTLLSATAVAFFLSLNQDLHMRACCMVDIFSWIRNNEEVVIGKNVVLEGDKQESDTSLAEIAFFNGLLACAKEDILCEKLRSDSCILLVWLFNNITHLCYGVHQYEAFQLLLLWFNKVSLCISNNECTSLFSSSSSQVVKNTMSLVWTHLDSPVDGVNHSVVEVFHILIKCLTNARQSEEDGMEVKKSPSDVTRTSAVLCSGDFNARSNPCQDLIRDILSQISQMSWHVKGKHRIAAAILHLVPLEKFLQMDSNMFPQLLECMGTNYLSPCATDLYKAIIQAIVAQNPNEEDTKTAFLKFCASPLLEGLTSSNSSVRHNVNLLWLPWTLKALPCAYELLSKKINEAWPPGSHRESLEVTISLYKCARNQQIISSMPMDQLYKALSHPDDKLRMDAFSLICITNKKSEALAMWEIEALEKFLPLNMNMDNAPFRQQLQGCLQKVMVRARDSSLSYLRSMKPQKGNFSNKDLPDGLLSTLKLVQAVWDVSIYSLHLASNFQRLKTSLDWITVVLDTFTFQPGRHQKKGNTPEAVIQLISFARKFDLLNFCNEESSHILLSCIFHGTDEIREMAAEILLQYFSWPLPVATENAKIISILQTGLELSLSPKPYESEAGALIVKLIFHKYIQEQGYCVLIGPDNSTFKLSITGPNSGKESNFQFILQLCEILENCLKSARDNILTAAQSRPAHGIVLGIRRCLSECDIQITETEGWHSLFVKLRSSLIDLLDLCLYVLGGRLHGEATAPSFEQMGRSIQDAVKESLADKPQKTDDPVLSTDYQIIATWCWVNIKEISMLLHHLVEKAVDHPTGQVILTYENIEEIGNLYFRILTQCRHRGAIEGCNVGFTKYCTKLLFSSVNDLTGVPRKLLDKVIDQVKGCSSAASITRRSAGLPLIVQSIVTAESKTKQSALLRYAVETLIEVIASPVEEHLDENKDLPQVHALNILKAVFRESSVATDNMQHLGTAAVATIRCFSSPYWAVRNGAIQLYETLLQRMLGQKRTRDDRLTTQTVQEFFTHFPNMQDFVIEQMRQAGVQHQQQGLQLHPSLFPILTILTKLTAGPQQLSNSVKELETVVASMKNSPIIVVREMSAQAILPLIRKDEVPEVGKELVVRLPPNPSHRCNFNDIHGSLLHINKLIQSQQDGHLPEGIKDAVLERMWLMQSEMNPCALVQLAFAKTVMSLFQKLGLPLDEKVIMVLKKEAEHTVEGTRSFKTVQPGADQFTRFLIDWWLSSSSQDEVYSSRKIQLCLLNKDVELKDIALSYLSQNVSCDQHLFYVNWKEVMGIIIDMVCDDHPPQKVLCDALHLVMSVYKEHKVSPEKDHREQLWPHLMNFIKREVNSQSSALSIGLSAVIVMENLQDDENLECLESWTDLLVECSNPLKADTVRQQVALALTLVGSQIVKCCSSMSAQMKEHVFWNLYSCTCTLLMDEQADIREQAARVELYASDGGYMSLHPNLALEKLVQGFVEHSQTFDQLFVCKKTLKNLPDLNGAIKEDSNKIVDDLFEPEDVNPYQEDHVVMQLELDNLQRLNLTSTGDDDILGQISKSVTLLNDALFPLKQQCAEPLNVTCLKATFRSLWHCFHIVQISTSYRLPGNVHDGIKEMVQAYAKLSHLHPILRRKLHQISIT